jgi:hypothetical protein
MTTALRLESWAAQREAWPASGRHILAQYDDDTIVVYQAYAPAIGLHAAKHGAFGPGFSMSRMTWLKPNFLWMMYRSGWGTKPAQEVTLALRLRRSGFDALLGDGVLSSFTPSVHGADGEDAWRRAVASSNVRVQWDPDHAPGGAPLERRAIQIGVRGDALERMTKEWLVGIEDVSAFVAEQRPNATRTAAGAPSLLVTPRERVLGVSQAVARRLGMRGTPAGDPG